MSSSEKKAVGGARTQHVGLSPVGQMLDFE